MSRLLFAAAQIFNYQDMTMPAFKFNKKYQGSAVLFAGLTARRAK